MVVTCDHVLGAEVNVRRNKRAARIQHEGRIVTLDAVPEGRASQQQAQSATKCCRGALKIDRH